MSRWYRAYEGIVTDSKLGEVALVAGCSRSVAIAAWHCILESACASNNGGGFNATPRNVAVTLHETLATIEAVFLELSNLEMIADQKITAWSKRQYESDNSTARSKKHRDNKAPKQCNVTATLQQQLATPPETDTDTDIKEEPKKVLRKNELETFWNIYPRKIAKGSAEKAWKTAIKKATSAEIIAAAQVFASLQIGNDPQFIAHPATWLNQERWKDEPQSDVKTQFSGQKNGYSNQKTNSIDAAFDGVRAALRAERANLEHAEALEAGTLGTGGFGSNADIEIIPRLRQIQR